MGALLPICREFNRGMIHADALGPSAGYYGYCVFGLLRRRMSG